MPTEVNKQGNKESMRLWVAALRSGEWQQHNGRLATFIPGRFGGWRFCCLGVACEIAIANGTALQITSSSLIAEHITQRTYGDLDRDSDDYNESDVLLPILAQQWLGIEQESPDLQIPGHVREWMRQRIETDPKLDLDPNRPMWDAAELNDEWSMPFELIADCVEYTFLREDFVAVHGPEEM